MKIKTTRLALQRRAGRQTLKDALQRLTLTLMLVMLTAMTAWADDPSWLNQGDSWDETTKTLTVNTETVAQNAYRNRSEIENVIISNDVTSIGDTAARLRMSSSATT